MATKTTTKATAARAELTVACVLLVDVRGRVLLQLRDGNTRVDPHCWCLPGGLVNVDEAPVAAAGRELMEECGLAPDGPLALAWRGRVPSPRWTDAFADFHVFVGRTSASPATVQCHEGAVMSFVETDVIPTLRLGRVHRRVIPLLLASRLVADVAATDSGRDGVA